MSKRTPDEITTTINDLLEGKDDHGTDVWSCIWEIIEDILHSVSLAENEMLRMLNEDVFLPDDDELPNIYATVRDYVVNHYGDD